MPNAIIEWTDSHGQIHHLQHRPGDEVTWSMPTPSGVHYDTRVKVTGYDLSDEVTPYEVTILELAADYDPDDEPHGYRYAAGDELMATAFDMADSPIEDAELAELKTGVEKLRTWNASLATGTDLEEN